MGYLEYRVFYSTGATQDAGEWFNSFVFDTVSVPGSAPSRSLARQLITGMKALHLPYVTVKRCHIVKHNEQETDALGATVFTEPASFNIQSEPRPGGESPLPELCLQLNKQAATGRNGRNWLFHCLSARDVVLGAHGAYILKTHGEFQQHLQFFLRDGLAPHTAFQMVIPPSARTLIPGASYRPCFLTIGHPVRAKRRHDARQLVDGERIGYPATVGYMSEFATQRLQVCEGWYGTGLDLTPIVMKEDLLNVIGMLRGIAGNVEQFAKGKATDNPGETVRPFIRWGRDSVALENLAASIKDAMSNLQEEVAEIKDGRHSVGGDEYWTHVATGIFKDYFEKVAHAATNLADFDYQTRYDTTGQSESASGGVPT